MHIEDKHDPSADEVVAIERRLYEHKCQATGFSDGKDLRFVARAPEDPPSGVICLIFSR